MKLSIKNNQLTIKLEGFEIFWSMKSSLSIPIKDITKLSTQKPEAVWLGLRMPGTCVPGIFVAGSYYVKRKTWQWEYWYYRINKPFLVLDVKKGRYKKIVLGLENNIYWKNKIEDLISRD